MRIIKLTWVMILFALTACGAGSSSSLSQPVTTISPSTSIEHTISPVTNATPINQSRENDASTSRLSSVTMEDEMAVRKLISAYFAAIGSLDDAGAWEMLAASMTTNFSKQDAEKNHFGIESVKVVSIEPYLRPQEPQEVADKPTIYFTVKLDIVPNSFGGWGKGSDERFVEVAKEQGIWKISALATSPEIYSGARTDDPTDLLVTWSPDHQSVAYLRGNPDDYSGSAYVWKVKEDQPVQITSGVESIKAFIWSPDSKFVLVDAGTSPLRYGQLFSLKTIHSVLSFNFMGRAIFSPDSRNLAIGFKSGLKIPNASFEPDDAFNLSIFHLDTLKLEHLLLTENARYSYLAQNWKDNRNLAYTRLDNMHDLKRKDGNFKIRD